MKAAVLYGPGDMRIVETPQPHANDDTVLVRVRAAGICGTDVHTYKTGIFKEVSQPIAGGALFGHEFSGDAVEVGKNIQGIKVGDRVTGLAIGAYAEYVVADPSLIGVSPVKLPDHVSYEEAATTEPLTVVLDAVRRSEPKPTDTVLIIGAGIIGLGCLQVLKALYPVKQIFVADVSDKRLDLARELGADLVVNSAKEDLIQKMLELTGSDPVMFLTRPTAHVDIVYECAGAPPTPQQALEVVTPNTGKVVLVATFEHLSQVDFNFPVFKNTQIMGIFGYNHEEFAQSVDLIASGKVNRKLLITHRFPLDQAREAFETQARPGEAMKVVIQP